MRALQCTTIPRRPPRWRSHCLDRPPRRQRHQCHAQRLLEVRQSAGQVWTGRHSRFDLVVASGRGSAPAPNGGLVHAAHKNARTINRAGR